MRDASVGVIGGADGPTAIFLSGDVGLLSAILLGGVVLAVIAVAVHAARK